ncbi:hypothetical protein HY413_03070 [Candidatus Kaiserbacteria bacterium]|nr:hypothetical protein [Candidatus Kaiserbacteria bacterium]
MTRFFAIASMFAFFAAAPAFAQQTPSCDSFPLGIERISKAENISQIDDVMVEFGSMNRLGEEGLQSLFNGDLDVAKKIATEILMGVQTQVCGLSTPQ